MWDKVILNGFEVSAERANTIMFVQCTVLRKPYKVDASASPVIVTIEGYEPDENDMKPDSEFKRPQNTQDKPTGAEPEPDATPTVKRCGTCGKHSQQ